MGVESRHIVKPREVLQFPYHILTSNHIQTKLICSINLDGTLSAKVIVREIENKPPQFRGFNWNAQDGTFFHVSYEFCKDSAQALTNVFYYFAEYTLDGINQELGINVPFSNCHFPTPLSFEAAIFLGEIMLNIGFWTILGLINDILNMNLKQEFQSKQIETIGSQLPEKFLWDGKFYWKV